MKSPLKPTPEQVSSTITQRHHTSIFSLSNSLNDATNPFFIYYGAIHLFCRFSREMMLLVGTSMMTIAMASIPMCDALWLLAIVLAVMGFFMGTIDTVANVSMICIYGKDVSPFLQVGYYLLNFVLTI